MTFVNYVPWVVLWNKIFFGSPSLVWYMSSPLCPPWAFKSLHLTTVTIFCQYLVKQSLFDASRSYHSNEFTWAPKVLVAELNSVFFFFFLGNYFRIDKLLFIQTFVPDVPSLVTLKIKLHTHYSDSCWYIFGFRFYISFGA